MGVARVERLARVAAELVEYDLNYYRPDWPERMQVDVWAETAIDLVVDTICAEIPYFLRQARLAHIWFASTDEDRAEAWAIWNRRYRGRQKHPIRQVKLWETYALWPGEGVVWMGPTDILARDLRIREYPPELLLPGEVPDAATEASS